MPVAAHPAVFPPGVGVVLLREVVEHLHVADQPAPGEVRLDQVVTEDGVVRERLAGRGMKRVHIVEALAGERTRTEEVLVHVR